jgi:hypothetical protein
MHENFRDCIRYCVRGIDNKHRALRIAQALADTAYGIGIPIAVFVDVNPSDSGWLELVKQLCRNNSVYALVAIREEDYRRASVVGQDVEFEDVELTLSRQEARTIYDTLTAKKKSETLISFENAWEKFGGDGPLMEFIYLVVQGESLRARLIGQVERLEDEARRQNIGKAEVDLLRLVAVASACHAKMQVKPLVSSLDLPAPQRTMALFEKEYLLRRLENGKMVEGLHPVRSAILAELLTDEEPCVPQ